MEYMVGNIDLCLLQNFPLGSHLLQEPVFAGSNIRMDEGRVVMGQKTVMAHTLSSFGCSIVSRARVFNKSVKSVSRKSRFDLGLCRTCR